jgi:hypothetical protein
MARPAWWLWAAVRLLAGLVWRGLVFLAQVLVFVAEPVDEFVTAWLGIAAVLPRVWCWWCWWRLVWARWRDHRNGVIQADVMEGVWR